MLQFDLWSSLFCLQLPQTQFQLFCWKKVICCPLSCSSFRFWHDVIILNSLYHTNGLRSVIWKHFLVLVPNYCSIVIWLLGSNIDQNRELELDIASGIIIGWANWRQACGVPCGHWVPFWLTCVVVWSPSSKLSSHMVRSFFCYQAFHPFVVGRVVLHCEAFVRVFHRFKASFGRISII